MKLIDIHSHLQFCDFDDSRSNILAEMKHSNQGTIVVGTNLETSASAVALASKHENVWATIGLHPTESANFDPENFTDLVAEENKVVAVGECGFDYFRISKDEVYDKQRQSFIHQISLAAERKLPLMLHGRPSKGSMGAYKDMLEILRSRRDELPEWPGNAHFFVGDLAIAKQFLELNFTLSFDGPITFARDYDDVIQYAPADMIHAETDAPYAAPLPYRGQQNSPRYVIEVVRALAEIRGEKSLASFQAQLVANACRVFRI